MSQRNIRLRTKAQSAHTLALIFLMVSVCGSNVEMTIMELGQMEEAFFSITLLNDGTTLSYWAPRSLVPVCMMKGLGEPIWSAESYSRAFCVFVHHIFLTLYFGNGLFSSANLALECIRGGGGKGSKADLESPD